MPAGFPDSSASLYPLAHLTPEDPDLSPTPQASQVPPTSLALAWAQRRGEQPWPVCLNLPKPLLVSGTAASGKGPGGPSEKLDDSP